MGAKSQTAAIIATGAISEAASAFASVSSRSLQSEFAQRQAEIGTQIAEIRAKDIRRRGELEAKQVKRRTKKLIGAQRAALAAQGVDVESGSALAIQEETAALGAVDALTIRNNAFREAFGLRQQALLFGGEAAFERLAARATRRATIATGGLRFARDVARFGREEFGPRRRRTGFGTRSDSTETSGARSVF